MESFSDDSQSGVTHNDYDDDFRPLRYSVSSLDVSEDDSKDQDKINQDENVQNVRCSAVSFELSPFYFKHYFSLLLTVAVNTSWDVLHLLLPSFPRKCTTAHKRFLCLMASKYFYSYVFSDEASNALCRLEKDMI